MRAGLFACLASAAYLSSVTAIPLHELANDNSTETHELVTRAPIVCASQLAASGLKIDLRISPLFPKPRATGKQDCIAARRVTHLGVTGGWDLPLTALPPLRGPMSIKKNDNLKQLTTLEAKPWVVGKYICDHVLELQVVKKVMEKSGGVCDTAAAMLAAGTPVAQVQASFKKLVDKANGPTNLVFLDSTIEKLKGDAVDAYLAGAGTPLTAKRNGYFKVGAVNDYLWIRSKSWSKSVASQLDGIIRTEFPGAATGVNVMWGTILSRTHRDAQKVLNQAKQAIENDKRASGCGAPPPPKRRDLIDPSLHWTAGLLSASSSSAHPGMIFSSLTARAAARRSGPRAAKAPSCPMKKPPPKPPVKRSGVKTKPKPARKPRRPTKRPVAKRPSAKKRTAKRPATRARRQPGKKATRKRTTPRKKPRKVPKPTRRPKGKARPRRRRR